MTHDCPGGCGQQVEQQLLACKQCWFRLPRNLRGRLTRAYAQRDRFPAAHRRALDACLDACLAWYRDNPRAGP